MVTEQQTTEVLRAIDTQQLPSRDARARAVVEQLSRLPGYDWSGVYWLNGDELVLGPFVGAPTEHARIPVGAGVCGAAVAENANQVVQDVRELDNYLSCSLETRSEIVVLIRDGGGRTIGQIDVDGHAVGAFDRSDEAFLEELARRIGA